MKEKAKQIAALLKMLANENRLMILCFLIENPMTVNEISIKLGNITQSAISQHLTLLKTSGILESEKSGQKVTYSISDRRVIEVISTLKKYYCE